MLKQRQQAVEEWISTMDFKGDYMVVTKEETGNFLTSVLEATEDIAEANRSVGIVLGALAATSGIIIGATAIEVYNEIKEMKRQKDLNS